MNDWFRVASIAHLETSDRHLLDCGSWRIGVFKRSDGWLVIENRCPHRGGPVAAGTIDGDLIQCPWHGERFELTTGNCVDGSGPLAIFETRVDSGELWACPKTQVASQPQLPSSDSTTGDVRCWTVRYGRPGHVGRFVHPEQDEFSRGQHVWIASKRGQELGEVLAAEIVTAERSATYGTILRLASADELQSAKDGRDLPFKWLANCESQFQAKGVEATIIDAERLADGHHVIVYFLGEATEKLGPIAVVLSDDVTRVRFEAWPAGEDSSNESADGQIDSPATTETSRERWKREYTQQPEQLAKVLDGSEPLTTRAARMLETHGIYRQRKTAESQTTMMIRLRAAGGRFTAGQLSLVLDVAKEFAGSIRLTVRQGVQLHGVPLADVRKVQQTLQEVRLNTHAACGDVVRSVVACPFPAAPRSNRKAAQGLARELAWLLLPTSKRHIDLFDPPQTREQFTPPDAVDVDPNYGPTYLPHKFKIGVGCVEDNCIDLLANDVGVLVGGDGQHADLFVGGRRDLDRKDPSRALGWNIGRVPSSDVLLAVKAVFVWYRDHGDREDRRRGRLRHAVESLGHEPVFQAIREQVGSRCVHAEPSVLGPAEDHLGWAEQTDGRHSLGIPVLAGRVSTEAPIARLLVDLSQSESGMPIRVTPQQNLLLCDIEEATRDTIQCLLEDSGVPSAADVSRWRRGAVSCPAFPSCSLATGEAERVLPTWVSELERQSPEEAAAQKDLAAAQRNLARTQKDLSSFSWSVAGCTNGCSRPWTADVGLVAVSSTHYELWVGGAPNRERAGERLLERVPTAEVVSTMLALYNQYSSRAEPHESLGDFCHRVGVSDLKNSLNQRIE